jgi:predicted aspartyl protease
MVRSGEKNVGRIIIEVELTNAEDLVLVKNGARAPDQVRRLRLPGVVDTGANHLVLPTAAAEQLGVPDAGQVAVRYADQRRSVRKMVENVRVDLLGRHGNFTAILEPKRTDVLIGNIVLESLDFVADCITQSIYPRDPKRIFAEIE